MKLFILNKEGNCLSSSLLPSKLLEFHYGSKSKFCCESYNLWFKTVKLFRSITYRLIYINVFSRIGGDKHMNFLII